MSIKPHQKSIVKPKSTPEAIVRYITEQIVAGQLASGDKFPPELSYAKVLGVAPMTLRAAFATLRELGMVTTRRGRYGGTFVCSNAVQSSQLSKKEQSYCIAWLREFSDWRCAISGEAAFLAAKRRTQQQLETIMGFSKEFDNYSASQMDRHETDTNLHISIAIASNNPRILLEEKNIQREFSDFVAKLPQLKTVGANIKGMHTKLIKAIANQRPEAARLAMIEHIESTYDWSYSALVKTTQTTT